MRTSLLCCILCISLLLPAQKISDYYTPFKVDNYVKLHTTSSTVNSGRSFRYKFIKTETINGLLYYLEEGWEYEYENCSECKPNAFRYMWLRPDEAGNIMLGAIGGNNPSGNLCSKLDSAMILQTPMPLFPNSFLKAGSFITYQQTPTINGTDSVISTTATAGTFTNCIRIRSIQRTLTGQVIFIEDNYYAKNTGLVQTVRQLSPDGWMFNSTLVDALINTHDNSGVSQVRYTLYPNPAVDYVEISGQSNPVTVLIYDIGGSCVQTSRLFANGKIDVRNLGAGIYFIRIPTVGSNAYYRFVKQ